MENRKNIKIILASAVLAVILNIFFGQRLGAFFSTLPLLNRLQILSPEAPIVINRREEIRVTESAQTREVISSVRTKLAMLTAMDAQGLQSIGQLTVLTSDGWFAGAVDEKAALPASLSVFLEDGSLSPVKNKVFDPASGLAFFKVEAKDLPIAVLGNPWDVLASDKIFYITPGFQSGSVQYGQSEVVFGYDFLPGGEIPAGSGFLTFFAQPEKALYGQAAVNAKGEVLGLWNGSYFVPSRYILSSFNRLLENKEKFQRPDFGFSFRILGTAEAKALKLQEGGLITKITKNTLAQKSGLSKGDVIISLEGDTNFFNFPEIFSSAKPGDKLKAEVWRAEKTINLELYSEELK